MQADTYRTHDNVLRSGDIGHESPAKALALQNLPPTNTGGKLGLHTLSAQHTFPAIKQVTSC